MSTPRILVVGDAMLDHYWDGIVERISPEAPVPILKITHKRVTAGGAANVALNLAALGSEVTLLSLVGRDAAADQLEDVLHKQGVYLERVADADYKTTEKIRYVSRRQQLLRADMEMAPPPGMLTTLHQRFGALLPGHDIVVLSDYAKGALSECQPMLRAARAQNKATLVDPKGCDYARYAGATLLKPNLAEFRTCAGDFDNEARFRRLAINMRKKLDIEYLLVTQGEAGMTLFKEGGVEHQHARVREVYDVSGAGDTVLATVAHMMALGKPVSEAIRWANTAAGIVVGKFGTASITREELEAAHHD
jgi:rfaE bifunctional protein kinase chain/domain